jgi:hypothetical protein
MVHETSIYVADLPTVEDWISGDDRTLAFHVVDGTGSAVDISSATVTWSLYGRPYNDDPSNAELTEADSGVEVVTDNRVDTTNGEYEVRIDGEATDGLWGEYWQRPIVEQTDGTEATWIGRVIITA